MTTLASVHQTPLHRTPSWSLEESKSGFQTSGGVPGEDFDVQNPNLTVPDLISGE